MSDFFQVEKLYIGHKNKSLLGDISLNIFQGEIVAIMGKNGCGKTTLIKTISGLLSPIEGQIKIFSKDILNLSLKERAKERGRASLDSKLDIGCSSWLLSLVNSHLFNNDFRSHGLG